MPRKPIGPAPSRLFLTRPEVQEWTGLSREAVQKMIDTKELVTRQDGARTKISRHSVIKALGLSEGDANAA